VPLKHDVRGQLMFLAGVSLTIGPQATLRFFMRRKNLKARALPATFPVIVQQRKHTSPETAVSCKLSVRTGSVCQRVSSAA